MKKLILTSLVAMLAATSAHADINPYVSAKMVYGNFGVSNSEIKREDDKALGSDESDWAPGVRAAVGARYALPAINGALRAELELGYHAKSKYQIENKDMPGFVFDGEMSYLSYGANVFYDLDTKTKFKPYVGVGLSLATIDFKLQHIDPTDANTIYGDDKANHFKWNVGAGVSYAVLPNLDIDLGYRYTNYGKFSEQAFSTGGGVFDVSADIDSHEVSLGARYTF